MAANLFPPGVDAASLLTPEETETFTRSFYAIDYNHTGRATIQELVSGVCEYGSDANAVELRELLTRLAFASGASGGGGGAGTHIVGSTTHQQQQLDAAAAFAAFDGGAAPNVSQEGVGAGGVTLGLFLNAMGRYIGSRNTRRLKAWALGIERQKQLLHHHGSNAGVLQNLSRAPPAASAAAGRASSPIGRTSTQQQHQHAGSTGAAGGPSGVGGAFSGDGYTDDDASRAHHFNRYFGSAFGGVHGSGGSDGSSGGGGNHAASGSTPPAAGATAAMAARDATTGRLLADQRFVAAAIDHLTRGAAQPSTLPAPPPGWAPQYGSPAPAAVAMTRAGAVQQAQRAAAAAALQYLVERVAQAAVSHSSLTPGSQPPPLSPARGGAATGDHHAVHIPEVAALLESVVAAQRPSGSGQGKGGDGSGTDPSSPTTTSTSSQQQQQRRGGSAPQSKGPSTAGKGGAKDPSATATPSSPSGPTLDVDSLMAPLREASRRIDAEVAAAAARFERVTMADMRHTRGGAVPFRATLQEDPILQAVVRARVAALTQQPQRVDGSGSTVPDRSRSGTGVGRAAAEDLDAARRGEAESVLVEEGALASHDGRSLVAVTSSCGASSPLHGSNRAGAFAMTQPRADFGGTGDDALGGGPYAVNADVLKAELARLAKFSFGGEEGDDAAVPSGNAEDIYGDTAGGDIGGDVAHSRNFDPGMKRFLQRQQPTASDARSRSLFGASVSAPPAPPPAAVQSLAPVRTPFTPDALSDFATAVGSTHLRDFARRVLRCWSFPLEPLAQQLDFVDERWSEYASLMKGQEFLLRPPCPAGRTCPDRRSHAHRLRFTHPCYCQVLTALDAPPAGKEGGKTGGANTAAAAARRASVAPIQTSAAQDPTAAVTTGGATFKLAVGRRSSVGGGGDGDGRRPGSARSGISASAAAVGNALLAAAGTLDPKFTQGSDGSISGAGAGGGGSGGGAGHGGNTLPTAALCPHIVRAAHAKCYQHVVGPAGQDRALQELELKLHLGLLDVSGVELGDTGAQALAFVLAQEFACAATASGGAPHTVASPVKGGAGLAAARAVAAAGGTNYNASLALLFSGAVRSGAGLSAADTANAIASADMPLGTFRYVDLKASRCGIHPVGAIALLEWAPFFRSADFSGNVFGQKGVAFFQQQAELEKELKRQQLAAAEAAAVEAAANAVAKAAEAAALKEQKKRDAAAAAAAAAAAGPAARRKASTPAPTNDRKESSATTNAPDGKTKSGKKGAQALSASALATAAADAPYGAGGALTGGMPVVLSTTAASSGSAGSIGPALMQLLLRGGNLTSLDLSGNKLTDTDGAYLAEGLKGNASLRTLNLRRNDFGPSFGRSIAAALSENRDLRELLLGYNRLEMTGTVAIVEELRHSSTIEVLDLSWTGLTDQAAGAVGEMIAGSPVLRELNLSHNGLTAAAGTLLGRALTAARGGGTFSAAMATLPTARSDANGGAGRASISAAAGGGGGGQSGMGGPTTGTTALCRLDLSFNALGDIGVQEVLRAVNGNAVLAELDLRNTRASDALNRLVSEVLAERARYMKEQSILF